LLQAADSKEDSEKQIEAENKPPKNINKSEAQDSKPTIQWQRRDSKGQWERRDSLSEKAGKGRNHSYGRRSSFSKAKSASPRVSPMKEIHGKLLSKKESSPQPNKDVLMCHENGGISDSQPNIKLEIKSQVKQNMY
jgi:hypothetical protein